MAFHPPITPPSAPTPEIFCPENFKKKATLGDYVIYALALAVLLGLIGSAVYYFTRPEQEKDKLRARAERIWDEKILRNGKESEKPRRLQGLKAPQLDGILGEAPTTAPESPVFTVRKSESKSVAVSTYSGGRQTGVSFSDDPKLPKATAGFIQFAESLKVSGVVEGNPSKVMLNGRMFRDGEAIDSGLGVMFVGVDGIKKFLILRDKTGAELRLAY